MFRKIKKPISAMLSAMMCMTAALGELPPSPDIENSADAAYAPSSVSFGVPRFAQLAGSPDTKLEPVAAADGIDEDIDLYGKADTLPEKFDLRESTGITSVKDQGSYGTCWAHSAAASAESGLLQSEPSIDLSELHTAYMAYYGDDQIIPEDKAPEKILKKGGAAAVVINLWSQWIGPVREERLPYNDVSLLKKVDLEELKYTSDFHLENAYNFDYNGDRSNFEEVNSLVKQFLYEGRAVDVSFYSLAADTYDSENNTYCTQRKRKFADHAVTLVGWDDNFPAGKFHNSPEGDGAWIVRNSWGSDFGDNGFFYISYYDKSLSDFAVYFLGDKENYDSIYQHDSFVPLNSMSAYDDDTTDAPSYAANIFTAYCDEQIEAIGTYFVDPGTEYEITIYTDLEDASDPSSGKASAVTAGVSDITGYYTVELSENVPVSEGENFAVVVKFYNSNEPYIIPVESCFYAENKETHEKDSISSYITEEQVEEFTGRGESFSSQDGKHWNDVKNDVFEYNEDEKADMLEGIRAELYDDLEAGRDDEQIKNADMLYEYYKELFAESDIKVKTGNVTLKAFASKVDTVDFSHISGMVPTNEKISLSTKDGKDIYYSVNGSKAELYSEPIEVTEKMTVAAMTDDGSVTVRDYEPLQAEFFSLGYSLRPLKNTPFIKYAERVNGSEYKIKLSGSEDYVVLYPVTNADIRLNGETINKYELYEIGNIDFGETVYEFELSAPDSLANKVKLTIDRSPVEFDLIKETVKYKGAEALYTSDGEKIADGSYVGDKAGSSLTAVVGDEKVICKIPERYSLAGLETDYRQETLGDIPEDTAFQLMISAKSEPEESDYISAASRLRSGASEGTKALAIIPGEVITLKASAGNDHFASRPVTIAVPKAPPAPEKLPTYNVKDRKIIFEEEIYETVIAADASSEALTKAASNMGYKDPTRFIELMCSRLGVPNSNELKKYINAEWSSDTEIKCGDVFAIRLAATDTSFASAAITDVELYEKGDMDHDLIVDASDATTVLRHATLLSAGKEGIIFGSDIDLADYNGDGIVDTSDATEILAAATLASSGKKPT